MRQQPSSIAGASIVTALAVAIGGLALIAALAGIFWPGGDGPYEVTTYRGQAVEVYGHGLYRDSSTLAGAGARGTDVVTLLLAIPLLLIGLAQHRRGSLRGSLLLAGALTWFTYLFGSLSLGSIAYNDLFLLYVAAFAASLWALVRLLTSVDLDRLAGSLGPSIPRRGPALFLIVSGAVTTAIWLIDPVTALLTGEPPSLLGVSTTLFTVALDLAVIAPATVTAGLLILHGRPAGYLLGTPLLVLEAMLAPMIAAQTLFQLDAGVELSPAEVIGPIGSFVTIAVIALWMLAGVLRLLRDDAAPESPVEPGGAGKGGRRTTLAHST